MKELDFLKIINSSLKDNSYLGDDCAYLKEFGLFITQDTLVENVHFKMDWTTSKQLAKKAVAVNLSDLSASACTPKYLTVSLSLPSSINSIFIKEFYDEINNLCENYNLKVLGGDLTGSKEICISICAIGQKASSYISSRKNAEVGDFIVVTGTFGDSHAGLYLLEKNLKEPKTLITKHLEPTPRIKEGLEIGKKVSGGFAMMDCSDGLVDALYKIADASKVCLEIDLQKVPVSNELKSQFKNYKEFILQGGEDYELIACIDKSTFDKLDKNKFHCIGKVTESQSDKLVIIHDQNNTIIINNDNFKEFTFNHFKD